ncbi:MAG: putative glycoside hydrolase [Cellulosilyticaceae bacterium]
MKKYKIKSYNSYYHYKKQKLIKKRIVVLTLVLTFILSTFLVTGKLQEDWGQLFLKNKGQQTLSFDLEQDTIAYGEHLLPVQVKGAYLPAHKMEQLDYLLGLAKTSELNALVIDVKNDYGYLTFNTDNQKLHELGCVSKSPLISDIQGVMDQIYRAKVYPIARIVAFKDNQMAKTDPSRLLHDKQGNVYKTSAGDTWLNPYDKRNWDYLLEVAKEAIEVGFKEIQFDYIRFHETMNTTTVDLPAEPSKTEIITEFTEYMYQNLKPYGVYISADVFGAIITSKIDSEIVGQDYKELAKHLDYLCPMVYPSHYAPGSFGIAYPDMQPYDVLLNAMQYSNSVIKDIPRNERRASIRPWIQSFTATWVNPHQTYTETQVREQIDATYDAIINEWLLWNGAGRYEEGYFEKE